MNNSTINNENNSHVLLRAYQFGDDKAFSELYSMYVQSMLNYGRCITSDVELIKDCIQDVFVKKVLFVKAMIKVNVFHVLNVPVV